MGLRVAPAGDREGARQIWPLVLAPTPALRRRQHRELPGLGVRPVGVGDREEAVDRTQLVARR